MHYRGIIFIIFIYSQGFLYSQDTINMIDKLHIKNEFKELEDRIEYLVRKAKIVNETEEIKQFHIFLSNNTLFDIPNYKADKEDYLNGSFLQFLKPNYYDIKPQGLFKKNKKYLQTYAYITNSKGELIATGDVRFVSNSRAYKSYPTEIEFAKLLFDKKFDFMFSMGILSHYICIKDNKLYVISNFWNGIEMYGWEKFVNCCFDKIVSHWYIEEKP